MGQLFGAYVDAKQSQGVLDYDDLLLYWSHMMQVPEMAPLVSSRFDFVLVDEYQDTNALQAAILRGIRPDGSGLTIVGDDAQSIYSFRSADTPEHIEEKRRLLFVAMSRAKDYLALMQPMRFYVRGQTLGSDKHIYAPRSRFIMDEDLGRFELVSNQCDRTDPKPIAPSVPRVDLKASMRWMWG